MFIIALLLVGGGLAVVGWALSRLPLDATNPKALLLGVFQLVGLLLIGGALVFLGWGLFEVMRLHVD